MERFLVVLKGSAPWRPMRAANLRVLQGEYISECEYIGGPPVRL